MKTKKNGESQFASDERHQEVRDGYTALLQKSETRCQLKTEAPSGSCCGNYTSKDAIHVPTEALQSSFGCGNPLKFTEIHEGQTVLDIGSGAGIDCFLAADRVGPSGKVIGLDLTPAMIDKARKIAREKGYEHVEFRLGTAENMPVEDASIDWIISNCVINLSLDKPAVFQEAYRVLKSYGKVSISDIVIGADLPDEILTSMEAYIGCLAGAIKEEDYLSAIRQAGFSNVEVVSRFPYTAEHIRGWFSDAGDAASSVCCSNSTPLTEFMDKYADKLAGNVWSAEIRAKKS